MAENEGLRTTGEAIVKNVLPDVCKTPPSMAPVPYDIIGRFNDGVQYVDTVRMLGYFAMTMAGRLDAVTGDGAGKGGGIMSGTYEGWCKPITSSANVRAKGELVNYHSSLYWMNGNGPDGNGNTIGAVMYAQCVNCVHIGPAGAIVGETEPPITPNNADEASWYAAVDGMLTLLSNFVEQLLSENGSRGSTLAGCNSGIQISRGNGLPKFRNGFEGYSAEELNDALLTIFGEISANEHPDLNKEAFAVASTILNRKRRIDNARADLETKREALNEARDSRESAKEKVEELAKKPSKYKKELGEKEYERQLSEARAHYESSTQAYAEAQRAVNAANSEKIAAESYVEESVRSSEKVSLSHIVQDPKQYEGYPKGVNDYNDYASWSDADQSRNRRRWDTAKCALETGVQNPHTLDDFLEFRSNDNGNRALHPNETRIGGNDFWR